ncbi:MAG: 7,8-didemethyl-8-hydroxy-5-deazariboflavin synthase subunit CofG [Leptolyngbya sp. SIO1D8]|nr:7,8-didemethyl-8-hydroxy-5-deazariboflavin synthase subunit CofG [Leptolyngbya sp. SIO1D8]
MTYSPALTLVPTYECFNRCSYCNFRVDPHTDQWMSLAKAKQRLALARSQGVIEILVLSGEVHPQSPRRANWLQHIYQICELALQMGFLPHSNVGPLSFAEMSQLKQVNVSMGLMVEQVTPNLLTEVHHYAPSKLPSIRLQQLEQAGKLQIPFTTGLLLGIGESHSDRIVTLQAISDCHDRWGHIQEVILQPYQQGTHQTDGRTSFPADQLASFVKVARRHLPSEIVLQIPPNLIREPTHIIAALVNGARDLGGLSPLDEVNPDYAHPAVDKLDSLLQLGSWKLQPRLPIYPQYDDWLSSPSLQNQVVFWRKQLKEKPPSKQISDFKL